MEKKKDENGPVSYRKIIIWWWKALTLEYEEGKEVLLGEKCDILLENEVVKEIEIKNEDVK